MGGTARQGRAEARRGFGRPRGARPGAAVLCPALAVLSFSETVVSAPATRAAFSASSFGSPAPSFPDRFRRSRRTAAGVSPRRSAVIPGPAAVAAPPSASVLPAPVPAVCPATSEGGR